MYVLFKQTDQEKSDGLGQFGFFADLEEATFAAALWIEYQELNIFVREVKDPKKRGFFDSKGLKEMK